MADVISIADAIQKKSLMRRLIPLTISIALLMVLRWIAVSTHHPWELVLAIVAGTIGLACVRLMRSQDRGLSELTLKDIAGAEFLMLLVLSSHWWPILRLAPFALACVMAPLAAHLAAALWHAMPSPSAQKSIGLRFVTNFLPQRMAPLVYAELTIVGCALMMWRKPRLKAEQQSFTSYGTFAPALIAVLVLSTVEIFILHLLLSRLSVQVATVATVIGLFGFIYIFGILKSLRALPTIVTEKDVVARLGTLHEVRFSRDVIEEVVLLSPCTNLPVGTAKLSALSAPNVLIRLHHPVALPGHFGKIRLVNTIALNLDRSQDFVRAIRERC